MLDYLLLSSAMRTANYFTTRTAESAASRANEVGDNLARLQARVAALDLALETMMRFLFENGRITEQDFIAMSKKVDQEDGVLDGRRDMKRMVRICPSCSRVSPGDRPRCMWCGEDVSHLKPPKLTL